MRTAVLFITDLQRREEAVFPDIRPNVTDGNTGTSAWFGEIMHEADENGRKYVNEMRNAVRTIRAAERRAVLPKRDFDYWSAMWE